MAILRARGGSPVTTCPPIRTSPELGCSRPAIVRSSVVLPHPDGPSSTRYSPGSVARSTPSIAWTLPPSKSLRRSRTSTTSATGQPSASAADQPGGAPLLEDRRHLRLAPRHRVLRRQLAAGGLGEH